MDIRPILSTLQRHKTASLLIVLEIAFSCAIICNAMFLISGRIAQMNRISGIAENEMVRVQLTGIGGDDNATALTRSDVAQLNALPGVKAATVTNQVPFVRSSWNSGISLVPDQQRPTLQATQYMADEHFLDAFGLRLVAGRAFAPDEFVGLDALLAPGADQSIPGVIVTRSMAERLFPGENAIGKSLYGLGEGATPIIGIVEHLIRPSDQGGPNAFEYTTILPIRVPYDTGGNYVLRTDPGRRDEVLTSAIATLKRNGPQRIILSDNSKSFSELRREYYQQDRVMVWLLSGVCVALLIVTALGIVGLASFWVQQRTRMIGIRRALGATRGQVLRYFQTENFLLAGIGIVLGMLLAYALNQLLMSRYELPRLPIWYLPVGAVLLWALGQLAVLGPARRAAAVPPAVATRSA